MPEKEISISKAPETENLEKEPSRENPREENILLEEKIRVIKEYYQVNYDKKRIEGKNKERKEIQEVKDEMKDFFLPLEPKRLKEIWGEERLNLIYETILKENFLLKEKEKWAQGGVRKTEIQQFIKKYGEKMLSKTMIELLDYFQTHDLSAVIINKTMMVFFMETKRGPKLESDKPDFKEESIDNFLKNYFGMKLDEVIEQLEKPSREEEKPIEITGFEEFDRTSIKGKEIIEKAMEILPQNLLFNLGSVKFKNQAMPIPKEYGIPGGKSAAGYIPPLSPKEKGRIEFYPIKLLPKERAQKLNSTLFHEWAHSLDPRIVSQKDLSIAEQFKIIQEFEKIREEKQSFSSYVESINNKNKKLENCLKSKEDWAESIRVIFLNPDHLKRVGGKRHDFFYDFLKKRTEDFDYEKIFEKKKKFRLLFN